MVPVYHVKKNKVQSTRCRDKVQDVGIADRQKQGNKVGMIA